MLEKEKLGFIYFVSVPISYTQQIRWKCGIEVLNKNISREKMTMLLWHLEMRKLTLMSGKLKNYFINQLRFSSRFSGPTSMMSKPPGSVNPHFTRKFWSANQYAFKTLHMHRNDIFRTASIFYFDCFHASVHRFIPDRKHYETVPWGGRRSLLPSLPRSTLLNFVIVWPIWLGISRYSLMT